MAEVKASVATGHLPSLRTAALTAVAMLAFAANSILCRLALAHGAIDPASFTLVRIGSGVITLWIILVASGKGQSVGGSWRAALALFIYAAAFSIAYVSLSAGAGALLLFGAVQVTMVSTGIVRGERLAGLQWIGFVAALGGLGVLLAPGVTAPPTAGACLMLSAGAAWGAYSLFGRGAIDPLAATGGNFVRAFPMAAILMAAAALSNFHIGMTGLVCAIISGAVASGIGYSIWYAALPGLSPAQGASVQLSVPLLTAVAGTLTIGESITPRLLFASAAVLGGIALVIGSKPHAS